MSLFPIASMYDIDIVTYICLIFMVNVQGGPLIVVIRGDFTPVTHLFSVIYRGPITQLITILGAFGVTSAEVAIICPDPMLFF